MSSHISPKVPPTLRRLTFRTTQILILILALSGYRPSLLSLAGQANRVRGARLDQRIPMVAGSTLRVENQSGSIRVRVWSQSEARVVAARPGTSSQDSWYTISSSETPPGLVTVIIKPRGVETIDVDISVPLAVQLELWTEKGSIEIAGAVRSVIAESQTGSILLQLPPDHKANLALHSTSGSIRSELPVSIFGLFDSHNLQAKLGQGGSAILLRTMSGNVSVLPLRSATESVASATSSTVTERAPSASQRTRPELRTGREPSAGASPESRAERSDRPVESATVHLEAPLVNLNVSVSDRSGRAISNLTKNDFSIYEDGVQQQITYFASASTPFDLVLLLDLSGSVERKIRVIKRAAQRFVDLVKPEDRLAVYGFRRRVQLVAPLTNDRELLKRRIDEIGGGQGGTAFYNALWFTLNELEQTSSKRKAIVVMSDGVDNSISNPEDNPSEHPFEELTGRVEESDVIVYPIYLDTEDEMVRAGRETPEAYAVARRQLKELAERTAGVMFRAEQVEDLEGVYQQVADELRTVYSLAYEPSNAVRDGTWRQIEVEVNRPTAAVRTKPGYYAR
ncbi:MAG: VWA domain-containing protein [Acidobacteria bacterium]|nr:VWA domain-containing protein [Acidobacteriota bacterium]